MGSLNAESSARSSHGRSSSSPIETTGQQSSSVGSSERLPYVASPYVASSMFESAASMPTFSTSTGFIPSSSVPASSTAHAMGFAPASVQAAAASMPAPLPTPSPFGMTPSVPPVLRY